MSTLFLRVRNLGDPGAEPDLQILADLDDGLSLWNWTALFGNALGLPSGFSELINDEVYVHGDQFCRLVEAIFARPTALLDHRKVTTLAGIYQLIKNKAFTWVWNPPLPSLSVHPRLPSGEPAGSVTTPSSLNGMTAQKRGAARFVPMDPTSQVIFQRPDGKLILSMDSVLAMPLIFLADVVGATRSLPSGLTLIDANRCRVDTGAFCRLVDVAFKEPRSFSADWAPYAAGLYDVIQNGLHPWQLRPEDGSAPVSFNAVRYPQPSPRREPGPLSQSRTRIPPSVEREDGNFRDIVDSVRARRLLERLRRLAIGYGLPFGYSVPVSDGLPPGNKTPLGVDLPPVNETSPGSGEDPDGQIRINKSEFCTLVETLFDSPVDLLSDYVADIAGLFESFTGDEFVWIWSPPGRPLSVQPIEHGASAWQGIVPLPCAGKTIGPEWPVCYNSGPQIVFHSEAGKPILNMNRPLAMLYILLTEEAAEFYQVPTGLNRVDNQSCVVNEEDFCLLVDAAFGAAQFFLSDWAPYAAGMYDIIRGELRFYWTWNPARILTQASIQPVRYVNSPAGECKAAPSQC